MYVSIFKRKIDIIDFSNFLPNEWVDVFILLLLYV